MHGIVLLGFLQCMVLCDKAVCDIIVLLCYWTAFYGIALYSIMLLDCFYGIAV